MTKARPVLKRLKKVQEGKAYVLGSKLILDVSKLDSRAEIERKFIESEKDRALRVDKIGLDIFK